MSPEQNLIPNEVITLATFEKFKLVLREYLAVRLDSSNILLKSTHKINHVLTSTDRVFCLPPTLNVTWLRKKGQPSCPGDSYRASLRQKRKKFAI